MRLSGQFHFFFKKRKKKKKKKKNYQNFNQKAPKTVAFVV